MIDRALAQPEVGRHRRAQGPTTWDPDARLNALTIQAAVDTLQDEDAAC